MRSITLAASAVALALAFAATTAADAAPRKRQAHVQAPHHRTHVATRITIRKGRTYLDPGTETLPLAEHFADYAVPPTLRPNDAFDPTHSRRFPLPDAFDLPGFNPYAF